MTLEPNFHRIYAGPEAPGTASTKLPPITARLHASHYDEHAREHKRKPTHYDIDCLCSLRHVEVIGPMKQEGRDTFEQWRVII